MNMFKSSLLAATMIAGFAALPVHAQVALPAPDSNDGDASLHGAGATSVQNLLVREASCIGVDHKLGNGQPSQSGAAATVGSLKAVAYGNYAPSAASSTNPALDCSVSANDIQPAFSAKYVGTGSGFGRKMWRFYKDYFDGSATGVTHVFNPFNTVGENTAAPDARWTHLQFAVSDTPLASTELADYNNGGTDSVAGSFGPAALQAGPAVQFPLFVLPVAVAYNTVYGKKADGTLLTFTAKWSGKFNGTTVTALRMSRQAYCGIFNGEITNWNDPILQALNGVKKVKGVQIGYSLADAADDATRWANDGAPIRLVGRLDNSGTTDVFTRHLAAVCSLTGNLKGTNKYLKNSENLPYNATANGNVDYTVVREDTNYKPSSASSKFAGTTNTVSGDWFDGSAMQHLSGTVSAAPTGAVGSGLFIVTNGGSNVGKAINLAPDYALNGVTLNGKIGYISADVIQPSQDAVVASSGQLVAALLQIGTGTTYAEPSLFSALKAFGTGSTQLLPPEGDANGAYVTGDTRQVNSVSGTKVAATRDNPLAWTDVLYVTTGGNNLAAPSDGYPIVGTTQFFGYTCYKPNNRQAVVEMLGLALGGINKNATNGAVSVNVFKGTAATSVGIFSQANIGVLPIAWQKALINTFLLKDTTTALGAKNLWIQDAIKPAAPTKKVPNPTTGGNNAVCSSLPGA